MYACTIFASKTLMSVVQNIIQLELTPAARQQSEKMARSIWQNPIDAKVKNKILTIHWNFIHFITYSKCDCDTLKIRGLICRNTVCKCSGILRENSVNCWIDNNLERRESSVRVGITEDTEGGIQYIIKQKARVFFTIIQDMLIKPSQLASMTESIARVSSYRSYDY